MTDAPPPATAGDASVTLATAQASARTAAASARAGEATTTGEAIRSAWVVSGVTLISRVLGLVRDIATAALFGASWIQDAFVLAFMVPNLFRRLFGEGSLSAAFVPVYTDALEHRGIAPARRLLANVLTAVVLLMAIVTVVVILLGALLPDAAFAFAFDPANAAELQKLALFRDLLPVLTPFVIIICALAVLGGALNVHGRFFVPAFAPVLLNVAWMAGIAVAWFALPGEPPLQALVVAGSVIVGATLGWLHHLVPLRRIMRAAGVANAEERLRPVLDLRDRDMRTIFSRMGPTLLGLGLLQVSVLIDNLIAEAFVAGDGAVSALYYGNRLMQFPLALIGTAMGIAVFPVLARHISRGELVSFRRALTDCTRITLFLAIPASVGLVVLAGPLVEVLFRRGAFEASAQARTAAVVAFYGLGVIAACVRMLQTRAFFALGDTRTPVRIAVQMTVLNLVGNIILVQTPLQEAGLALSTAVTTTLSCVALSWKLRRMDGASTAPPGEFASLVRSVVRSCLAAGIMAAGVIPAAAALGGVEGGWRAFGSLGRVAVLGGLVAVAIGVFLVAARLLRAPELRELLRRGR